MSENKMQKILTAALDVFANEGFEKATIDEIALQAGVAKGTVFYHYKSKEELFVKLIERGIELLVDSVQAEAARATSPENQLKAIIEVQTNISYDHPQFFRILLSEVWGKQDRQQVLRTALHPFFKLIDNIVAQGIAAGSFMQADPENLSAGIFGMVSAAVLYDLLNKRDKNRQEVIKNLQDCLLHGILA